MTHTHRHEHVNQVATRPLFITLAIVVVVMIAEIIGGIVSHSLALISDAGHMMVDALALGLSLFAANLAKRPSTLTRTFGYHRVEIMAALANGSILVLVAAFIFFESYQRFREPSDVQTPVMLLIAIIGLIANITGVILLRKGSRFSLNIRGAFWHVLGDTISSVGVITAAIVIMITGWIYADPVVAIIIGIIILWGAVRLVRESVDILMESVPKHINTEDVVNSIQEIPGVQEIHDVHIWTITSGIVALSAHLIIQDQMVSHSTEVREQVNRLLEEKYNINHTTLQLECDRCEACPVGVICQIAHPDLEKK